MSEDRPFCRRAPERGLLLFLERKKSLRSAGLGPRPRPRAWLIHTQMPAALATSPPPLLPPSPLTPPALCFEELIPELVHHCPSLHRALAAVTRPPPPHPPQTTPDEMLLGTFRNTPCVYAEGATAEWSLKALGVTERTQETLRGSNKVLASVADSTTERLPVAALNHSLFLSACVWPCRTVK